MTVEKVVGFVDGQPVYYTETEPTQYETTAGVEDKSQYDVEITAEDDYGNQGTVRSMYYVSGEWIEPVVDRILQDLKDRNDRAYLNYWDLNRIEMNTEFLSDLLYQYGYGFGGLPVKTDWDMTDFPYSAEMERIRSNIQALIDVYYAQEVPLPATLQSLDWQKLNDLENNLKLMKEMIGRMEQSFRYSGTFNSGQEVAL